ncbi:MAG: J domain-containing protein [Chloroflexota bacterium]
MTGPLTGPDDVPVGSSSQELFAWASQSLSRGQAPATLTAALERQGWAPELAVYFIRSVEQARLPARRQRGRSALISGACWLNGGFAAILVCHQAFGTWSTSGPLLVGWGIVACGCLRLLAGIVEILRSKRPYLSSRNSRAPLRRAPKGMPDLAMALDFQALGLEHEASFASARQAYRQLVKAWHPDRFHATELRELAERRMKLINASYARIRAQWRE